MKRSIVLLLAASLLSGCGAVGRLSSLGKPPKISPMEQATAPAIEPSLGDRATAGRLGSGPQAAPAQPPGASLFRTGAGTFFHDQRAARVGDILTVRINIADNATLDNSTSRTRANGETAGMPGLLGLESQIGKVLPGNPDPAKLVDASSTSKATGAGNTSRSEQINTTVAAIVTGVLPNGNLMIQGHQEVRVNFELRELVISGIVRPEDIARDNSIRHSQVAEARISYGGRGQLTDVQQARWGQQIYDALFPF